MNTFIDKLAGALYGTAIGDGMGAPVEGRSPERILARFGNHGLRSFLPPTHRNDPATGKGDGRITDDTLMTEALIRAYDRAPGHLDAYGYEQWLLPEITATPVWVPERQQEMPILDRLWWPEKYPWLRLTGTHADPRQAGVGNCVNCAVVMWMIPVGAVNAGDPVGACAEATALGLAHNESFAIEAAGVMAACAAAARSANSREQFIQQVRAAVAPFDQRTGHVADDAPLTITDPVSDIGKPSRLASIEELPVALAALVYGGDDFFKMLGAAVFYGRDCDSIAGMAAGLWGALHGRTALPAEWCAASDCANRRDFAALAGTLERAARRIAADDTARQQSRHAALCM